MLTTVDVDLEGLVFVQTLSTWFQGLVKILKLMFRQDFEAEVW